MQMAKPSRCVDGKPMGSPTLPPEEKREEEGVAIGRLRRGRCLSWNRNWSMVSFAWKCWRSLSRLRTRSSPPKGVKSKTKYSRIIEHDSMHVAFHFYAMRRACLLLWETYAFPARQILCHAKQVANPEHFTSVEIRFHFKLWTVYHLWCQRDRVKWQFS